MLDGKRLFSRVYDICVCDSPVLIEAVSPRGTAPRARPGNVNVAGKTASGVATNGHPFTAFIGMTSPENNPRWIVGVLMEFPEQNIRLAGETAAPVFASIIDGLMAKDRKISN